MKKIVNIMFLSLLAVCFTACSDDDATYTPIDVLQVISADVEYDAAGGKGAITVEASSVEASCESSWVTATVSGNVVNLQVAKNEDFDGRSAKVALKSGGKKVNVVVTQKGIIYGINGKLQQAFDNAARSFTLPIISSDPVELKSNADWISASYDDVDKVITVTLKKNETGWKRVGTLDINSGKQHDVLTVSQVDLMDVILGNYNFYYYDANGKLQAPLPAVVSAKSLTLTYKNNVWTIPLSINSNDGSLTVGPCGSYVGKYSTAYFIYLMWGGGTVWTGFSNVTSVSTASYAEDEDEDAYYVDYEFGGKFGSTDIEYWNFQALKVQQFASENSAGYLLRAYFPIMEKVIEKTPVAGAKGISGKVSSKLPPYLAR